MGSTASGRPDRVRVAPTRRLAARHEDWLVEGVAVRRLRRLFPARRVQSWEAFGIAERQAMLLLAIWGVDELPVPVDGVGGLWSVEVRWFDRLPVAGASVHGDHGWTILVDTSQCWGHQRFAVAHELKHVVDGRDHRRYVDDDVEEAVADFFARCVLMPRPWVKQVLASGSVSRDELAEMFGVARSVVDVRLAELGLECSQGGWFSRCRRPRCRRRVCPR